MNRRQILACLGAGTTGAVGGCLDGIDAAGEPADEGRPAGDDRQCPPYSIDGDRAVCSHTVDPDTATVYLDADPRTGTLEGGTPAGEITLTLYNRGSTELRFNPYSWDIRYRSGDEWRQLRQQYVGDGVVAVSAGDTHTWSFLEAVESIRHDPELAPGRYAAEIGVPEPERDDEWIGRIALVRLEPSG